MSNFDASTVNGLIGLWDFRSGAKFSDTGLDDGVAQNGWLHGGAGISGDKLHLDGHGDYFEVDGEIVGGTPGDSPNAGDDDPFDMSSGTLEIQSSQDSHVGTSPDTLVANTRTVAPKAISNWLCKQTVPFTLFTVRTEQMFGKCPQTLVLRALVTQ